MEELFDEVQKYIDDIYNSKYVSDYTKYLIDKYNIKYDYLACNNGLIVFDNKDNITEYIHFEKNADGISGMGYRITIIEENTPNLKVINILNQIFSNIKITSF